MNLYSNWSEVNRLIDNALELAKEEREAFLENECSNQPELLADARDYLRSIEKAEDEEYLETITSSRSRFFQQIWEESLKGSGTSPVVGQQIGHYTITSILGEGGMGSVFLAERTDGEFEHQVAIKFLRGGFYSSTMRDRFSREKQILARLNHPNIAGLLDGGITDEGVPYMIMEYVDGTPVDCYCQNHSLQLNDRLNLFLQICNAVQHAHSKLVIHRDLKPQNIFVTEEGRVKVMDFGIAKFLNNELDEEAIVQTREGYHVASVEFAAPEQFRSSAPSTSTDVYGLGVLLYLLLTDKKPFVFKGKSLPEIEQIVQTEPPPRPANYSNPAIGSIPPDLESIILKALRKEPELRYETVRELIGDIQRFLAHQPVLAGKGSKVYRAKKYIYRNRKTLTAATFALIFVTSFLTYHLQTISRHINQTEMEAETARTVTDFIVELFDVSDPIENEEGILTAAALLQRGQNRFNDLDMNPEVQLELLGTLGNASTRLGNYENAEVIYFKADSIAQSHYPQHSLHTAQTALQLGHILTLHRKFFEAEGYLNKALLFFSKDPDQYWQEQSDLLLWLGSCLLNTDRAEQARQTFSQALEIEQKHRPDSRQALNVQLHLAQAYKALNRFETAEDIYLDLLNKIELNGFSRYDIHRSALNSIANLHLARQEYDEAYRYYNTALEEAVSIYGELHPNSLKLKSNVMYLFVHQKDYERAIEAGKDMLYAKITRHGEHSHMAAQGHASLGLFYYLAGKYDEAIKEFETSHSIFKDLLGPNHQWTVNQIVFLALTKLNSEQETEGNELFKSAVSRFDSQQVTYDFFAHGNLEHYIQHFEENTDRSMLDRIEQIKLLYSRIDT